MIRRRTFICASICAATVLALGGCGSDDDSAADTTAATEAVETADDTEDTDDTEGPGDDTGTTAISDATDETDETADDNADGTIPDVPVSLPPTDDVPVCQAFSQVLTTSFFLSFAGSLANDDTAAVERAEVVAYAGLSDALATLRRDVPAELLPSLEPFLIRLDAAPGALAAGGFTEDEIAAIGTAWGETLDAIAAGVSLEDAPDPAEALDPAKLDAAAAAFVAVVGSFEAFSSADSSSDMDEEGEAWLQDTCPLLSASVNAG